MATAVETKERPILFSGPMVRAILDGRKTQTRRVAKLPDDHFTHADRIFDPDAGREFWRFSYSDGTACQTANVDCPYGVPGDRLWVRETWALVQPWSDPETGYVDEVTEWKGAIPDALPAGWKVWYAADCDDIKAHRDDRWVRRWRPSIFVPRWASRITLEVKAVRVERLREITEEDAIAEGAGPGFVPNCNGSTTCVGHRPLFIRLWNEINAGRGFGWDANPWVWVVEFARVA